MSCIVSAISGIKLLLIKKVTLENYREDPYYPKIVQAVASVLRLKNHITPIEVFQSLGLLTNADVDNWRKGKVPYLEKVIKCNLGKASRVLRILRFHAHDLNLKPSLTVYKRNTRGGKIPLRFSKSGEKALEEVYSRHFVAVGEGRANNSELRSISG